MGAPAALLLHAAPAAACGEAPSRPDDATVPDSGGAGSSFGEIDPGPSQGTLDEEDEEHEQGSGYSPFDAVKMENIQLRGALLDLVGAMKRFEGRCQDLESRQSTSPGSGTSPEQLQSIINALKPPADPTGWMISGKESCQRPFMEKSNVPALADGRTEVSVSEVISLTPLGRVGQKSLLAKVEAEPEELLMPFVDSLGHHAYVDVRRNLVLRLGVLANLQAGLAAGDQAVDRIITSALERLPDDGKHHTLGKVRLAVRSARRQQRMTTATEVLELMDEGFAKSTVVERDREIQRELEKISASSHKPSSMLVEVRDLYAQKFAAVESATRDSLIDNALRSFVISAVQKGATDFEWMRPFRAKLDDIDFMDGGLDKWDRQFKLLEEDPAYRAGFAWAATLPAEGSNAANPPRSRARAREVSFVDHDDTDGPGGDGRVAGVLSEMSSRLAGLEARIAAIPSASGAGGDRTRRDPADNWASQEWVAKYGVVGFPAPGDKLRRDVMVGEIFRRAGLAIPEECPRQPSAMVGFHCPCNQIRRIPANMWFYHEQAKEFKDDPRRPPPGAKAGTFAYMHRLGKCSTAYKLGHELGRANAAHAQLLQPLTQSATDCIGPVHSG
jgi:hypothetical protein